MVLVPRRDFAAGDAYICATGWEESEDSQPVTRMLSMAEKMLAATRLMARAAHTYTKRAVMLCHYILSSLGLAPFLTADMCAVQASSRLAYAVKNTCRSPAAHSPGEALTAAGSAFVHAALRCCRQR